MIIVLDAHEMTIAAFYHGARNVCVALRWMDGMKIERTYECVSVAYWKFEIRMLHGYVCVRCERMMINRMDAYAVCMGL